MLFIDARQRFKPGRNQNTMDDEDIRVIDTAYKTGQDIDGQDGLILHLADLAELEANGFDLNIGRYIRTDTRAEADVDAALATLREAQAATDAARAALDERLKDAGFNA